MKKSLIILSVLAVFSCRKEDSPYVEKAKTIQIENQSVYFQPDGGDGFIDVVAEGEITAKSARPWCHVSVTGKHVSVKVDPFNDMQSRYSKITIFCGADSVYTTAQQQGVIIGDINVDDAYFGTKADSLIVPYTANVTLKAVSNVEWITTKVGRDTLRIYAAENKGGLYREGEVTCTLGSKEYKVNIAQVNINDIKTVKDWTLSGKTPQGGDIAFDVVLQSGIMNIQGTGVDWNVTPTFNNANVEIPLSKNVIGNYTYSGSSLLVFATAGNDVGRATSLDVEMTGVFPFGVRKDSSTGKWILVPAAKTLSSKYNPLCLRFDMWKSSKASVMQSESTYSIVLKDPIFRQK